MSDTTFTWHIANMERETADGYVFTIHYTVEASDGVYRSSAYGSLGLERPEGSMIPYADLIEDQVVMEWLLPKFGDEKVQEIHAALQAQLDEQHHPSKASGMPWQQALT
jgi:hypothetical protein